jgi:hypothetical protein
MSHGREDAELRVSLVRAESVTIGTASGPRTRAAKEEPGPRRIGSAAQRTTRSELERAASGSVVARVKPQLLAQCQADGRGQHTARRSSLDTPEAACCPDCFVEIDMEQHASTVRAGARRKDQHASNYAAGKFIMAKQAAAN